MSKITVIHHSADYDGIFCREIARKFLPEAELIGWDYGDPQIPEPPHDTTYYVLDLSPDCVKPTGIGHYLSRMIWIDHHKSAIDKFPTSIPGYRIDGVAACRLAWQWFSPTSRNPQTFALPDKQAFTDRTVSEPLAVRLAGEYDVWDHRDNDADVAFQFGLDAQKELQWGFLLGFDGAERYGPSNYCSSLVNDGRAAMQCYAKRDADIMRSRSFQARFEGLNFLALNTARCNSNTFAALDVPETGHDALLAFFWTGETWSVSMYHAAHRKDLDLSAIAVKYGGGGHRGACGFRSKTLPFLQISIVGQI